MKRLLLFTLLFTLLCTANARAGESVDVWPDRAAEWLRQRKLAE